MKVKNEVKIKPEIVYKEKQYHHPENKVYDSDDGFILNNSFYHLPYITQLLESSLNLKSMRLTIIRFLV